MWSGSTTNIPAGWALCNGSNGTPDLRNRFIVGAGSTYAVGNTGGSTSVTLTEANLPAHTHTATVSEDGEHTHKYYRPLYDSRMEERSSTISYNSRQEDTSSAGKHTHTVTIGNTGSGTAHENRPPYYALAYIMKL